MSKAFYKTIACQCLRIVRKRCANKASITVHITNKMITARQTRDDGTKDQVELYLDIGGIDKLIAALTLMKAAKIDYYKQHNIEYDLQGWIHKTPVMIKLEDLKKEDFNWTKESVIGRAILLLSGETDSTGAEIDPDRFYNVGKHKQTGQVLIIPVIDDANEK